MTAPHPSSPPAVPMVPVERLVYSIERHFPDVPGALRATEDIMERELLEAMTPRHGQDAALRALAHVKWEQSSPAWPGDLVRLVARLELTIQQAA